MGYMSLITFVFPQSLTGRSRFRRASGGLLSGFDKRFELIVHDIVLALHVPESRFGILSHYFGIGYPLAVHPHAVDKRYYLPADVIDFTQEKVNPGWLTMRGNKMYDSDNAEFLEGTSPFKVRIIRLLTFEDLPIMARRMVKGAAVMLFQQSYDGDSTKIQEAQQEYQMAYTYLNTQHIKSVGANFLPRRGTELRGHSRRLPT